MTRTHLVADGIVTVEVRDGDDEVLLDSAVTRKVLGPNKGSVLKMCTSIFNLLFLNTLLEAVHNSGTPPKQIVPLSAAGLIGPM